MIFRYLRTKIKFWEYALVLVIIAAMVAILFPVFQKVHTRGPARCPSNLKQLGLAFIQYTQDADEKSPPGINSVGNGWAGELYPYVKSTGIYHCPNDEHDGPYISYAENQNLVKQNVVDFADPAKTVELYEFTTLNCDPATGPMETVSATGLAAPQNSTRHDADTFALNFLAADGHVKSLTPGQVSGGPNAMHPKRLPHGFYRETFSVK